MKEEVVGMLEMLRKFFGMLPFLSGKARAILSILGELKKRKECKGGKNLKRKGRG